MQIGIRALDESLRLQKSKKPLIHCILNPDINDSFKKGILCYNGESAYSDDFKELIKLTTISDCLLIVIEDLNEEKVDVIERCIRTARSMSIPIVLDILGVNSSFFNKEITLRFINRYKINVVKGTLDQFEALINEKKEDMSSHYEIKKNIKLREKLRRFSKNYETIIVVEEKDYYLSDGFSELYINRYFKDELKQTILSGLISVGVASVIGEEEIFKSVLVAIMAMAVSEKIVIQEKLDKEQKINFIHILEQIKNINSCKLDELSKISYSFVR